MTEYSENLMDYCAEGVTAEEQMLRLSDKVQVRLITFTPAMDNDLPPILFVPGWISVMAGWREVLLTMTTHQKVYYLETREKKTSIVAKGQAYDVEAIAEDIAAAVDQLGLKDSKYILFGSSLGGTTILDCHRKLKARPKCLVLIGPNAEIRVPRFGRILVALLWPPMYTIIKPFVKWYLKHFRLDVNADPAQYTKYCHALDIADAYKLKQAVTPFARYKVWDLLSDIRTPVLIFNATKDVMHEPENLYRMTSMLPKAVIVDMETNHDTHSSEMVREMYEFISTLG